jgi:hypothetical protein
MSTTMENAAQKAKEVASVHELGISDAWMLTRKTEAKTSTKQRFWRLKRQNLVPTYIQSRSACRPLLPSSKLPLIIVCQGIFYFLSHRSLWKPLLSKLVPTMSLSLGVVAFMFLFTYVPQVAVLVFVNGPLAAFTTVLLVLSESSTLINLLSRNFLIQDALVDTFDGTLVARRQTNILSEGRELKAGNFNDPMAKLGKMIKSPFQKFTPKALIRYVMYLPLNFIPIVGTIIFLLIQGKERGKSAHGRVGIRRLSKC